VRRVAAAACELSADGMIVLVSLVSPHAAPRDAARAVHEARHLRFIEVHVATPIAVCERRDPKGLYARARWGELTGLTGIDDPYEPPVDPDLRVGPHDTPTEVAELMVTLLERVSVSMR
jgi:bifunctional enzyme CysN/CysC